MKKLMLGLLGLTLAGWTAAPVAVHAQSVVVTRQVSRPAVSRTVVVRRPAVRRTVVVTRPAPVVVGVPFVGGVAVGRGPCRTVTRQVRSGGRVVTSTRRVCS